MAENSDAGLDFVSRKVRGLINALQKNLAAREKHAALPKNFLPTEVALDDAINELGQMSASAKQIEALIVHEGISSLASIAATHPNPDVAQSAVNVIGEIADPENFTLEDQPIKLQLAQTLFTYLNWPDLVWNHLQKFDKSEEEADAEAVASTLQNLSHCMSLDLSIATTAILSNENVVRWLFDSTRVFDQIALYACDILADISSFLISDEDKDAAVRLMRQFSDLGRSTMMDVLALGSKSRKFASTEAKEVILTLTDCLQHCLDSGAAPLLDESDFDVVMKYYGHGSAEHLAVALKLLPGSLKGNADYCDAFVRAKGLKTIFSVLSAHADAIPKQLPQLTSLLSIVESLVSQCRGAELSRTLSKLTANGMGAYRTIMMVFVELTTEMQRAEAEVMADSEMEVRHDWLSESGIETASTELQALEQTLFECSADLMVPSAMICRIILRLVNVGDRMLKLGVHGHFGANESKYRAMQWVVRRYSYYVNDAALRADLETMVKDHAIVLAEGASQIEEMAKKAAEDAAAATDREQQLRTERNRETRQKHKIRRLDAEMKRLQGIEDSRYARKKGLR